jgi:hypothetical protein
MTFDSYSLTVVQPPVEVSAMRISLLRLSLFPPNLKQVELRETRKAERISKVFKLSPGDRAEISQHREDSLPNATRRKESLDLVDTFELFKVYFDNKLGGLPGADIIKTSLLY